MTTLSGEGPVIGVCWQDASLCHRDLRQLAKKYGQNGRKQTHAQITREEFDALPAEEKMGLRFEDFRRIIGKYAEVLAVPMYDRNEKLIGGGDQAFQLSIALSRER